MRDINDKSIADAPIFLMLRDTEPSDVTESSPVGSPVIMSASLSSMLVVEPLGV